MKVYFLTGATGVVGSALIPLLLKNDPIDLRLLVRSKAGITAEERVSSLLEHFGLNKQEYKKRIQMLEGDICESKFGLLEREYERLACECTHIIHCAGNVKSNLPPETAWHIAVTSVKNTLDLARMCHLKGQLQKVEVVSTIGIGGTSQGLITETRHKSSDQGFHNSYEWAKSQAEEIAWQGIEEGLPITVHRPSMIVGDSRTGKIHHFQVFYYLCEFLSGKRTAGVLPDFGKAQVDIIPIDFVAQAIAWSSLTPETEGNVLHLCAGPEASINLTKLVYHVRESYQQHSIGLPRLRIIPLRLFRSVIPLAIAFASKKNKRRLKTLYFFLNYLGENQHFENMKTMALLQSAGIDLPNASSYLKPVLEYYLEHRK